MRCYYDLHMHTALSPCADEDMTPNNIVNMAVLKGLDFIAITDHNSVQNLKAVIECAKDKNLIVIPAMEVESSEEAHLLCFFPEIEGAFMMGEIVKNYLPRIKNRPEIFGNQIILDTFDEVVSYEPNLLMTATSLSIDKIKNMTEELGGVVVPSHIDRSSYSIISNLGFIPDEYGFATVEISKCTQREALVKKYPYLEKFKFISNSDAHNLGDISERINYIDIEEKSIKCLLDYFRQTETQHS